MVRHTLNILQQMQRNSVSLSVHFGIFCIKGLNFEDLRFGKRPFWNKYLLKFDNWSHFEGCILLRSCMIIKKSEIVTLLTKLWLSNCFEFNRFRIVWFSSTFLLQVFKSWVLWLVRGRCNVFMYLWPCACHLSIVI